MNPLLLIGIALWIYILSILKRSRIASFYFIVGSVGLFLILVAFSKPYIVWILTQAVIKGTDMGTSSMGMTHSFSKYGILFISNSHTSLTMSIDYECSGIIESAGFIGLIVFYPIYTRKEKLLYAILGFLYIYLANIIRIFIIINIVYFFGSSTFFLAHSIIGRIVFYSMVIAFYYRIFTYSQIYKKLTLVS